MEVEINALGVVLAAVAAMVVNSVWYAEGVMGKEWMKLVKLDKKKAQKGAAKAMVVAGLGAFITAYVLAHVSYLSFSFFEQSFQASALTTAFWLWLGLQFTHMTMNGMFEQKPTKLIMINSSAALLSLVTMALVLGWVGL